MALYSIISRRISNLGVDPSDLAQEYWRYYCWFNIFSSGRNSIVPERRKILISSYLIAMFYDLENQLLMGRNKNCYS